MKQELCEGCRDWNELSPAEYHTKWSGKPVDCDCGKEEKPKKTQQFVEAEYRTCSMFVVPEGIDLNNEEQCIDWYVKYNTLTIINAKGEVKEIEPLYDATSCDLKHPDDTHHRETINDLQWWSVDEEDMEDYDPTEYESEWKSNQCLTFAAQQAIERKMKETLLLGTGQCGRQEIVSTPRPDVDVDDWDTIYYECPFAEYCGEHPHLQDFKSAMYYQTYSGGPEGGYLVVPGRGVYKTERNWGVPFDLPTKVEGKLVRKKVDGNWMCRVFEMSALVDRYK